MKVHGVKSILSVSALDCIDLKVFTLYLISRNYTILHRWLQYLIFLSRKLDPHYVYTCMYKDEVNVISNLNTTMYFLT